MHLKNKMSAVSEADLGEARSITNQTVLFGCTPLGAVRRFQPRHRDRSNSVARMPGSQAPCAGRCRGKRRCIERLLGV